MTAALFCITAEVAVVVVGAAGVCTCAGRDGAGAVVAAPMSACLACGESCESPLWFVLAAAVVYGSLTEVLLVATSTVFTCSGTGVAHTGALSLLTEQTR
jgi:hypothetical protein